MKNVVLYEIYSVKSNLCPLTVSYIVYLKSIFLVSKDYTLGLFVCS